jgi:hypothetical protein
MQKLSHKIGSKWAEKNILPLLQGFMSNPNYLYRENALFGIKVRPSHQSLVGCLSLEVLSRLGATLLEMSTTEKIPNVMILVLQAVHLIKKILNDKSFDENARIMYNTLLNDPDSDVAYYAKLYATK